LNKLPPELVSLVHHVELNKAGWWERGIQRFAVAAVWLSGKNLTTLELGDELKAQFSMSVPPSAVEEQVRVLLDAGTLVRLPDGKLKVSEGALSEFQKCVDEAEQVEAQAKLRFERIVEQLCPSLHRAHVWREFNEKLITPLVSSIGARTYELISGGSAVLEKAPGMAEYLGCYAVEVQPLLRAAVLTFLDPKDAVIRSFILRQLNAYFFVEAGGLESKALLALAKASMQPPSFAVFLDTNFLFSILELHENPSNEAAQYLIQLLADLKGKISCKLYVFPKTLDEIKGVIAFHRDLLKGLDLAPSLAAAALDADLTGVARKFAETATKATSTLRAEDYFSPYLTDLIPILRKRGIEFFNQRVDGYATRQDVVDDLLDQLEFEKKFKEKAKTYAQLEHDMILWHFVTDKRPAHLESPLEAKYWIVTVDYHFLGFDQFKRKQLQGRVPVCLHPTALIQMLQFWIPRSEDFEKAVLGSLRWPFLYQEFDVGAERMTIRILEVLSRFENAGDLPRDVLGAILVNDALRQKLALEKNVEKQIELVKEALVEENQRVRAQLALEREQKEQLERDLARKSQSVVELERSANSRELELGETRKELQDSEVVRKELEERLVRVEKDLHRMTTEAKEKTEFWAYLLGCFIGLLLLETAFSLLGFLVRWHWGFWRTNILAWTIGAVVWVWLADTVGARFIAISRHPIFSRLHRWRKWIYGVLLTELAGHAVWELVKGYFS